MSPNIYLSNKTKRKLTKFIKSSRVSPVFGSPNRFKSPNEAIEFLLEIGLKFPLSSLEKIVRQPFIELKMRMSDSEFEEFERKGELRKLVEKN
jgi:hypothetical protein